jgi:hypothetical protein
MGYFAAVNTDLTTHSPNHACAGPKNPYDTPSILYSDYNIFYRLALPLPELLNSSSLIKKILQLFAAAGVPKFS